MYNRIRKIKEYLKNNPAITTLVNAGMNNALFRASGFLTKPELSIVANTSGTGIKIKHVIIVYIVEFTHAVKKYSSANNL